MAGAQCDVCNIGLTVGVGCVPGIPLSVAYCRRCLEEDAHPLWCLLATISCCGGPERMHPDYQLRSYLDGRYVDWPEVVAAWNALPADRRLGPGPDEP